MKILKKNQKGATAVEFAIVVLLLLTLIFGIIEFSLFLFNKQVLTNACREGARTGVVMRSPPRDVDAENSIIKNRVIEYAADHLVTFGEDTFTNEDVTINPDADGNDDPNRVLSFGKDLIVQATYKYDFLFLSTINIGPITIKPVSTMKME